MSPHTLHDDIYRGRRPSLLATFWGPKEGEGEQLYQKEHLPSAQFCDPAAALAGVPSSQEGRNPLPDPRQLQRWFHRWGLPQRGRVVVYDDGAGLLAARTWWILRWAGLENIRILDGGLRAWLADNLPVVGGPGSLPSVNGAVVSPGCMPTADIDDVREHAENGGLLVDAREASRFAGRREILDLKAGHIPGAVNLPAHSLQNEDRTFRGVEEIRDILGNAGITRGEGTIVYSGSGNHSALLLAAMEFAGITGASHYLGGWSQWSADRCNPVEHGE